jgi:chemotaxis signal transduction protein
MRERKARDSGTECRYLLFRAGPVDFAIPHDAVTGILPDPPLLPLPSNPDGITGILPHPVMPRYALDLRRKFSLPPSAKVPMAVALKGHAVILLVDSILDSANIGAIAIRPVPRRPSQLHRKYACGVWRGRSRPCFLLDLDALLGRRWLAATQSPSADLLAPRFDPPQP